MKEKRERKESPPWSCIPGDVLCRILELTSARTIYWSRLVCKHWNECWKEHDWAPVWLNNPEGPWLLMKRRSRGKLLHEVWCPKTNDLFRFPLADEWTLDDLVFDTSSHGLVVGRVRGLGPRELQPDRELIICNPLTPLHTKTIRVPCLVGEQQPRLLVENAARGIYKVAVASRNSTLVYDSVTDDWETIPTPKKVLSRRAVYKACARAPAASRNVNPFNSTPGAYFTQFLIDKKIHEFRREHDTAAWKRNSSNEVSYGYPSIRLPFDFRHFLDATTGRCISVLLKPQYPKQEHDPLPFVRVRVFELAEDIPATLKWKRLSRTGMLHGKSLWDDMSILCAENLLVVQLEGNSEDLGNKRQRARMEPYLFDLEDRSWSFLEDIDDKSYRTVCHIFKPNPLARSSYREE